MAALVLALPCPVVTHLLPQELHAWRSTIVVLGAVALMAGTFTVTNSDLHVAHLIATDGVPGFATGDFIKADAPPLVTTSSARAAVVLMRAAIANVMMVFMFRFLSFFRRFISPF